MPSSLIFAALAAAWLVVLVPMFARRRQEVARTTDTALAARVVRRGTERAPTTHNSAPSTHRVEEAFAMPDTTAEAEADFDDQCDDQDDGQWRQVHSDDVRAGRRYRPGRGGFDPEAAALAARAKYARRQRLVLGMLVAAVLTGLAGAFVSPLGWWLHGLVDLTLVSYLTYLRRQVRIEEDIRHRRLARLSGPREVEENGYVEEEYSYGEHEDVVDDEEPADDRQRESRDVPSPRGVVVDIDDEDPMFDELDERTWEPYRRAVGE